MARTVAAGGDRFVFARAVRRFVGVYVAVAVLVCLVFAPSATDARRYVEAMVLVWCVCAAPGLVLGWRAGRRVARKDRLVWGLWLGSFALSFAATVRFVSLSDEAWASLRSRSVGSAVVGVVLLVVTNSLILRSRSGQRAVLIDIADIVMVIVAVVAPLALVVLPSITGAAASWFTVSASLWFVGSLYCTAVAVVLCARLDPRDRQLARFGVLFGLVSVLASAAQAVIGVADFSLRAGPFLAAHALVSGFTVLFFLHSTERASTGLERFPARDQVRRPPAVTLLVVVAIPVTGLLVWSRRDEEWAVAVALGAAGLLVVLFCVRSLLAARETRMLYREVERSADERGELLSDVLAHAEADRHRAATHLHRQSVQLYTALSSAAEPIGRSADPAGPAARVTQRLRDDLGRQSDELRRFALAVRPEPGRPVTSFATPLRVQLDGLYPEDRRPDLRAAIDPDLVLAWTDEAVLARVAEDALRALASRSPAATHVRVDLQVVEGDLVLAIELDGPGDPGSPRGPDLARGSTVAPTDLNDRSPELSPVRAGAELLGGGLEVQAGAGTVGIVVRVPVARMGAAPPAPVRPDLRLVD